MIKISNDKEIVLEQFATMQQKKARSTINNEVIDFLRNEIVVKKNKFIVLESEKEFRYYAVLKFLRDELKIDRSKFNFTMLDNYHCKKMSVVL